MTQERLINNLVWNQHKEVSREANLALRDRFVDGQMFRRQTAAKYVLQGYLRRTEQIYSRTV